MNENKIYIYSHPDLGDDVVKIGKTKCPIHHRAAQYLRKHLNDPYLSVHFAKKVENCDEIEKHLHWWLKDYKANGKPEEYRLDPEEAKSLVMQFIENPIDCTPEPNYTVSHRRSIYGIPDKLWRQAKAAAAAEGTSLSEWIGEAIKEKLDKPKKEDAMSPYIIIRKNNEVIERIPFDADNLSVAISEVCEEVRKRGHECEEEDVEFLPAEREAQGPDTPERVIIDV